MFWMKKSRDHNIFLPPAWFKLKSFEGKRSYVLYTSLSTKFLSFIILGYFCRLSFVYKWPFKLSRESEKCLLYSPAFPSEGGPGALQKMGRKRVGMEQHFTRNFILGRVNLLRT